MVDEQDRLLPIANVGRIMKQVLPPNAKISKEAKQRMQECATEFISFVTGEASEKCHKENRKTVNGDDLCWALSSLGFDEYSQGIVRYLYKYREAERERANETKVGEPFKGKEYCASTNKNGKLKKLIEDTVPLDFGILEKGSSSCSLAKRL